MNSLNEFHLKYTKNSDNEMKFKKLNFFRKYLQN